MMKKLIGLAAVAWALAGTTFVSAQTPSSRPSRELSATQIAQRDAADQRAFEHKAELLKDLGATQVNITEGLPIAFWEEVPGDPYPAWFVHHATLFKMFPPALVRPFMNGAYADRVKRIVTQRCQVLARHGMKAEWRANEPGVLPEPFFVAHPEYRGPRIDQPSRSRTVFYAPNVDNAEVLALYRESVRDLFAACPQVATFVWVTTDAGSGFDWAPGLYAGANGSSDYADRPLASRVVGFMKNIQQAATDAGHPVRININQIEPRQWMIPTFGPDVEENIVRQLPAGLAVNGKEGPDGKPFQSGQVGGGGGGNSFYPIVGLATPGFAPVSSPGALRSYNLGDAASMEFNYRLFKATQSLPMRTIGERVAALRAFAVSEVGEAQADKLLTAWQALEDVQRYQEVLNFGAMLRFGHVLNRWITRPMVPFPAELTEEEKAPYRPFLFQAKGEEQASNLADIQAMRMYEGWGARLLFERASELSEARAERARRLFTEIAAAAPTPEARSYWDLTARRTQALVLLLRSAEDMVKYQAQLDRVKGLGVKPEDNPVLGVQPDWARTDMVNLARREIDTAVALQKLLAASEEPILDLAPTAAEETIMRLGPDTPEALARKVRTMSAHWRDYDRLFTIPNP